MDCSKFSGRTPASARLSRSCTGRGRLWPCHVDRLVARKERAMARKIVTQYAVFHNIGAASEVVFYYQGGGADTAAGVPVAEAAYIVDLLRNEKPISYDA